MCKAVLNGVSSSPDAPIKFTAGLVMSTPIDADIYALNDPSALRIRIHYPDHQTHVLVPTAHHLRLQVVQVFLNLIGFWQRLNTNYFKFSFFSEFSKLSLCTGRVKILYYHVMMTNRAVLDSRSSRYQTILIFAVLHSPRVIRITEGSSRFSSWLSGSYCNSKKRYN